jgi:hypothetical protein
MVLGVTLSASLALVNNAMEKAPFVQMFEDRRADWPRTAKKQENPMNLLKKRALAALIATCLAPCAWSADEAQHPAHAKIIAADSSKPVLLAGLRPQPELVWQRTSPNSKELDGPVLYQILFRSSAMPGHLPKIAPNFTLTDSLISEGNGFIAIGALSINSSGIVTFANGQTFPGGNGTVSSISAGAGLTGGTITTTGTIGLDTAFTDNRYLRLNGGAMAGTITFANGQTFPGAGTITGIATGPSLTGGGTSGNVFLNIAPGGVTNPMLAANSVSNANIADGSLNPAKIAGTAAILGSNSFTGNQSITGNITASGAVGIGTSAPAFKLQAVDSDATASGIQINASNTSTVTNSFSVFSASANNGAVVSQMYADGLGTGPLGTPGGVFGTFTPHPIGFFTGNIQRMGIDTDGSVSINNKITIYNGVPTAGNGVPSIVAAVNLTGLKTGQNLALFTPSAPGLFRVSVYELCTTADASAAIASFLNWRDLSGTDQSITLTPSGFIPALSCNAKGRYTSVSTVVQSVANIPIGLQVTPFNAFTTGDYAVFATVEQLF